MKLQPGIGKPACKHQCNNDLRNKSDHPKDQCIQSVFQHVRMQKTDIIGKSYKIRTNLLDSRTEIFKKSCISLYQTAESAKR